MIAGLKIGGLVGGLVAGVAVATVEMLAAQGVLPATNLSVGHIFTAISFGGVAGWTTTAIMIGEYKNKVNNHEREIADLHTRKADHEALLSLQRTMDEVQRNVRMLVGHALKGGTAHEP